jgi:hypothetical protein
MVTLKLLLWLLVIAAFVVGDWYQIKKKHSRPNYLLENILKGIAFILYGAYVFDAQNDMRTVNLLLWCAASWWIFFDISMGVILHGNPFYIGPNSGWIDRLGVKYPIAYWIAKLLALYVLVHTTINFYTKFS